MSPSNRRGVQSKEAKRRARTWSAKQQVFEEATARKRRDNIISTIALVAGISVAALLTFSYFTAGPGSASATASAAAAASSSTTSSSSTATTTASASASNTGDVPDASLAEDRTWTGSLKLNGSTIDFSLDGQAAPQAVASFISLVQEGFYNNLTCHRLVDETNFHILQCGDPSGDGTGGPGYSFGPIENAPSDNVYTEGVIAMARQSDNANSMGSQFFIVFGDSTIPADTAGGYTVFGSVTSGLDAVKTIASAGVSNSSTGTPTNTVTMTDVTVQ